MVKKIITYFPEEISKENIILKTLIVNSYYIVTKHVCTCVVY